MASGYDISASASNSSTFGADFGDFTVGGNSGSKWLPLALVAAALVVVLVLFRK